ncbi:MAG: hypothetical protein ACRD04_13115 [Terriglobales bacterium]
MKPALLLISRDAELEARLRRALPPAAAAPDLTVLPALPESLLAFSPGCLLLLDSAAAPFRSIPRSQQTPVPAVLWLGVLPLLAKSLPPAEELAGPVVDFLDRSLPVSKLAFILQQHLEAVSRCPRDLPAPPSDPAAVQAAINNALTGILGNAELAAELAQSVPRRLPPPLAARLQCIVELASRMRRLISASVLPQQARP